MYNIYDERRDIHTQKKYINKRVVSIKVHVGIYINLMVIKNLIVFCDTNICMLCKIFASDFFFEVHDFG